MISRNNNHQRRAMFFSDADRDFFDKSYDRMRMRIEEVSADPAKFGLVHGERPYIWKRFNQLKEMTREQWIAESEADCAILRTCYRWMTKDDLTSIDKQCENIRMWLHAVKDNPGLVSLVEGEDQYIWDNLVTLCAMSQEELMQVIEADNVLLNGYCAGFMGW